MTQINRYLPGNYVYLRASVDENKLHPEEHPVECVQPFFGGTAVELDRLKQPIQLVSGINGTGIDGRQAHHCLRNRDEFY